VAVIGDSAFSGCTGLTGAYFEGNAPASFGLNVFNGTPSGFALYYPASAGGWTTPTWNGYPALPYSQPVLGVNYGQNLVTPSFGGLAPGTSYQLQVSTNLTSWTNSGPAFSATNTSELFAAPFNPANGKLLFFRLKLLGH